MTKQAGFTSPLRKEWVGRLARRELGCDEFSTFFSEVGAKALKTARLLLDDALKCGVSVISVLDDGYPAALRLIDEPPLLFFAEGTLPQWAHDRARRSFAAIVGTRRPTTYGQNTAFTIARELTERGVSIVSGLASGIDTAAHKGAMEGARRMNSAGASASPGVAVLGSGLRAVYPPDNERLARQIIEQGGAVISEYGVNEKPRQFYFPERNRIVAALCAVTIVVEAGERSGAAITARLAAEQGREVFAVPGPIDSARSIGTNRLLRDGARPYTGIDDVMQFLDFAPGDSGRSGPLKPVGEKERRIVEVLEGNGSRSAEELAALLEIDFSGMQILLAEMELHGSVFRTISGNYTLRRPLC